MGSVNKVMLLGRLGRDVELRHTNNDTAYASVGLATSERRKQASGEWVEETEWHQLKLWGRTAELAAQHLGKGSEVHVEGRLQTRKYTGRDGVEKRVTEVVVDRLTFVGARQQSGGGGYGQQQAANPGYGAQPQQRRPQAVSANQRPAPQQPHQPEFMDDDIPF